MEVCAPTTGTHCAAAPVAMLVEGRTGASAAGSDLAVSCPARERLPDPRIRKRTMNTNFKRKLLAGLLAPALALAVGSAFAQSSGTTGGQGGSAATQGSAAGGSSNTTGTAGASTTMSGGAAAGTGTMWNTQHFDRLDKNRDGRISREEAQGDSALTGAWSK